MGSSPAHTCPEPHVRENRGRGPPETGMEIRVIISGMKPLFVCGWVLALGLLSACAAPAQVPATRTPLPVYAGTLLPYQTRTPTSTPIPANPATPTPLPTLTPTPRTHVVKAGEDMSGIALRYRVPLAELKAANPTVIPNAMRIGTVLIIPGTAIPNPNAPTPTSPPVDVLLEKVRCNLDAQGSAVCFVMALNQGQAAVENVSAAISLIDPQAEAGTQPTRQVVTTPLNLLLPGESMPLMAAFPAPLPAGFQPVAELVSRLPASEGGKRYLTIQLENKQVDILPDGLTAEVSGEVVSQADKDASQVWVAAIAYDNAGNVIGMRRWENTAPLPAAGSLPFSLRVYSTGANIDRVDLLGEAQP